MPLDFKTHKQNNEIVKASGGAVGLTENPAAMKRCMIAVPEQAGILTDDNVKPSQSHKKRHSTRKSFRSRSTACTMS